jgi:hypothetical protein
MDQVASDINDPAFLTRYQEGLKTSRVFRNLQIAPGNYGESGTHEDLARQLIEVELPVGLKDHPDAMALLMDGKVEPFKTRTPAQCARVLIQNAAFCSAKMNFALEVSSINGFAPFADATPYGALLASKYQRAVTEAHKEQPTIQLTDLSFAIFDEFCAFTGAGGSDLWRCSTLPQGVRRGERSLPRTFGYDSGQAGLAGTR